MVFSEVPVKCDAAAGELAAGAGPGPAPHLRHHRHPLRHVPRQAHGRRAAGEANITRDPSADTLWLAVTCLIISC